MGISLNFSENSRQKAEFYLEFGKKAEFKDEVGFAMKKCEFVS